MKVPEAQQEWGLLPASLQLELPLKCTLAIAISPSLPHNQMDNPNKQNKTKTNKKQKGFILKASDPLNSLSWTSNNSVVWYLIALNLCFYPVIPSSEHTTFLLSLNYFPSFNALKSPLLTNSLISLLGYCCVINMTPKMKCCFFYLPVCVNMTLLRQWILLM